jgi:hypothetical protein
MMIVNGRRRFPMNVDGSWDLVIDSPMGKQNVIIPLKEDAGRLTGTLLNKSNNMETDLFRRCGHRR